MSILRRNISSETGEDTDFSKVVKMMMSDEDLEKKTVLTTKQATALATLYTLQQICKIQFLKTWIPNYCRYMISSSGGRGRTDVTEIAKHFYSAKLKSEWDRAGSNQGIRRNP